MIEKTDILYETALECYLYDEGELQEDLKKLTTLRRYITKAKNGKRINPLRMKNYFIFLVNIFGDDFKKVLDVKFEDKSDKEIVYSFLLLFGFIDSSPIYSSRILDNYKN